MKDRLYLWVTLLVLLVAPFTARATNVDLVWSASAGVGAIAGIGTNSVTFSGLFGPTTLTLDINLLADSDGLSLAFMSLEYDRDHENELNFLSSVENFVIVPGLSVDDESTLVQKGRAYGFDGVFPGPGGLPSQPFAQAIFAINPLNVGTDGFDVFSGLFDQSSDEIRTDGGDGALLSFTGASVNKTLDATPLPEPGTFGMLAFGLGMLGFGFRRSSA